MIWRIEKRGTEDAYYLQTHLFGPIRALIVKAEQMNPAAPFYVVTDGRATCYCATVDEAKRLAEFLIRSEEKVS